MKTFFASLGGAVIGSILGLILLVFIGSALIQLAINDAISSASGPATGQDDGNPIVLTLDLRNSYADQAASTGPEAFFGGGVGFIDVISKLDAAAADDQVKGLFIRGSEFGIGSARSEEYRDAFLKFKAADKFIIAHSQGTFGGGPSSYRAIAAADEIWAQPGTDLIASGLALETLFLRGLFDNISVTPEFEALYEYKNAPNTYEEETYTEPHRLAMTELAESLWNISLSDIAADRGMSVSEVRTALESTPMSAEAMVETNLATQLGWPEDALDAALARAGEDAISISVSSYEAPSSPFGSPVIAIVGGQGPIVTGDAGGSFFQEGNGFASDTIADAILEAGRDEDVQAIVFRVDSPGGSPSASDQIWRAIERIQEEEQKPVIVSMASVAASGGYYVSTGADWIIANRTTITGSIGIFGGKFAIEEGLARIGVNAESIKVGGSFTGAFSTTEAFTDEQRTMVRSWLQRGYDRFTSLVSEGRGLTLEQVDQVARGRVWSGEDALDNGLVDQLGGLTTAIAKAKELAEIDAETQVRIVSYPMSMGSFPLFSSSAGASAQELRALGQLAEAINDPAVQALIMEAEAARSTRVQARMPNFIER
ncbi:MAG: signal peptide peptidase SppA [Hyphomonadaceae bacterium]|nr:signal peptide peptidase SppA [Hyphomonadaceae bacterium]